ncbi:hypothetical protein MSAN_00839300 [Mycena sanguinolenta]|uniref:Uncharacterized protein n=1 Tax=Mycena sanguinolenta TaxID=230812 RepID=A0A8H7DD57_9AGAR|nr:hypothetical protein MSAN_00839300 [Mycena sanguinolenta]
MSFPSLSQRMHILLALAPSDLVLALVLVVLVQVPVGLPRPTNRMLRSVLCLFSNICQRFGFALCTPPASEDRYPKLKLLSIIQNRDPERCSMAIPIPIPINIPIPSPERRAPNAPRSLPAAPHNKQQAASRHNKQHR